MKIIFFFVYWSCSTYTELKKKTLVQMHRLIMSLIFEYLFVHRNVWRNNGQFSIYLFPLPTASTLNYNSSTKAVFSLAIIFNFHYSRNLILFFKNHIYFFARSISFKDISIRKKTINLVSWLGNIKSKIIIKINTLFY